LNEQWTMRVGLLGGTFDPPHDGHLKLARLAWEHLKLDELRFVPAHSSPNKSTPVATKEARLAMLREMLAGSPFGVEELELGAGGISYTVDTLETLDKREPDTAWILIIGSDQASGFATWRKSGRILELASVAIATRPGIQFRLSGSQDCLDGHVLPELLSARVASEWSGETGQVILLPSTELELASSQIRKHYAEGETPMGNSEHVRAVILHEKLYR
jgi:nicotinate-nucleotide adenylyltransferase